MLRKASRKAKQAVSLRCFAPAVCAELRRRRCQKYRGIPGMRLDTSSSNQTPQYRRTVLAMRKLGKLPRQQETRVPTTAGIEKTAGGASCIPVRSRCGFSCACQDDAQNQAERERGPGADAARGSELHVPFETGSSQVEEALRAHDSNQAYGNERGCDGLCPAG